MPDLRVPASPASSFQFGLSWSNVRRGRLLNGYRSQNDGTLNGSRYASVRAMGIICVCTAIHAEEMRAQVKALYSDGRFWPRRDL